MTSEPSIKVGLEGGKNLVVSVRWAITGVVFFLGTSGLGTVASLRAVTPADLQEVTSSIDNLADQVNAIRTTVNQLDARTQHLDAQIRVIADQEIELHRIQGIHPGAASREDLVELRGQVNRLKQQP